MRKLLLIAILTCELVCAKAQTAKGGFKIMPAVINIAGDTATSISWQLLSVDRLPSESKATVYFFDKKGNELAELNVYITLPTYTDNYVNEVDKAILTELKRFKKSS